MVLLVSAFPIWVWMLVACLMAGEWAKALCCPLGTALNIVLIRIRWLRRRR